jgi:hypothetical protein
VVLTPEEAKKSKAGRKDTSNNGRLGV